MSTTWIRRIKKYTSNLLQKGQMIQTYFLQYWFRGLVIASLVLLFWHKDLHLQVDLSAAPQTVIASSPASPVLQSLISWDWLDQASTAITKPSAPTAALVKLPAEENNLANTYSNMGFPEEQNISNSRPAPKKRTAKEKKQLAYIKRFVKVAQSEMKRYGIPASIKLAQGLIESNAGESPLSRKNNNHFGMKCFSKRCKKGHCSNFTDDSHKDFFRRYNSAWESYRAHSVMLQGKRYKHLQKLGVDYKAWALGLKKAGYATDKKYAQKLIHLIENLGLQQYDQ